MSLTYATFTTELALLAQFPATDPNFLSNLPSCIDYATDRITRELNLLNTQTANSTLALTTGTRLLDMSSLSPAVNVLMDVNVITPHGVTNPDLGTRNQLTIQSRAFLNAVYGTSPAQGGVVGVPEYFSMATDQEILVGPYPDQAYQVELIATVRPSPISPIVSTNWITTYLPDLLLAAAMIQMSGFKMNFGAQADNPQMAMSWETQYVTLRDSAGVEDAMRKYFATGWTSQLPSQYNPPRE